jgi:hypothetical protein
MIMLPKALSLAILSVEVRREDLTLNDIIVRLTAIQSIADVPLPLDDVVAIVDEEEALQHELWRQTCSELGMLVSPAVSTTHH